MTVTAGEVSLAVERRLEQGQRRLLVTFPAGRPGQHRVEARLARQDIGGSPLLLPVVQDPCRALAQLGLQQLAGESGGGRRKRPVFKAEGRTVAVVRQPRGPGCGGDGGVHSFLLRYGGDIAVTETCQTYFRVNLSTIFVSF